MGLTVKGVDALRTPGRYGDGGGLWVEVSAAGRKSWSLRFMLNGRARQMGLGACPAVTLAEAREKAADARKLLSNGIDPIEARRASVTAHKGAAVTFAHVAEEFIASHEAGWRNPRSAQQWRSSLAADVYPVIGGMRVSDIGVADVLRCLKPIWAKKPETASRIRGRIENVLDAAKALKLRSGENPASWRGSLDKLLPSTKKLAAIRPHPALPYPELPELMRALRAEPGAAARALEFMILTAARSAEALGASWSEIDLDAGIWTIPAGRMKSGQKHRVPLSGAALDLLVALPRSGKFVFVGARYGRPLGPNSFRALLKRMNVDATPHGFRSTFRDWAGEETEFSFEICEKALAHAVGNETSRAYARGDLLERRRDLMDAWAAFCASPPRREKVVQLHRRARAGAAT